MSIYTITDKSSNIHEITVVSGEVVDATPSFDWAIGLPFSHVRAWAEKKGWPIAPVIDRPERCIFQYKGSTYCIYLRHQHVDQITKDGEPIVWADLPPVLKGML